MLGRLVEHGRPHVALLPVNRPISFGGPAYELHDSHGRRQPVDHRLADRIATTGWAFYRPLPDGPLGFADLWHFCRGLRGLGHELGVVLMVAFFGALLGLSLPIASGILVDQVLPEADLPRLAVMCGFLAVLTIAAAVFQAIQGVLVIRVAGRVSATLIPSIWERLLRLPSRFFASYSSGDLALRAMGLSEVFQRASGAVVTSIVTGLFSLFNLGLLYGYSWKLALCTSLLVVVLLLVTVLLLSGRLRHEVSIRRIDGVLSGLLLELFGGMITLRSAGAEGRALARWARRYGERLIEAIQSRRSSNALRQWLAVYPILTSLVVYTGAVNLDPELMKAGSFLAFNIAFANLVASVLAGCYTAIGLLDLLPMCRANPADPRGEPRVPRGRDRAGATRGRAGPEPGLVPIPGAAPGYEGPG